MVDGLNEANEWQHVRDVLPDDVIIVDASGVIVYVSDAVSDLAGYAPEELVGSPIERLVPDRHGQTHVTERTRYQRAPTPRLMSDHRHPLRRSDSTTIDVAIALSPLTVEASTYVVASVKPVDADALAPSPGQAIKLAAAALLAEREADYRTAFEHTPAPMFFAMPDDTMTVANDAYARLVGRPLSELVGQNANIVAHPDDIAVAERATSHLVSNEQDTVRYSMRFVHVSGRVLDVEVSKSAVRARNGTVRRLIVSVLDSTDRRRRERAAALLSQVRRLAIVASAEKELLSTFCDLLVEVGGFRLVTYATADQTTVVSPAWGDEPLPRLDDGPGSEAIATRAAVLYGSAANGSTAWRRFAADRGLASAAAVPLSINGVFWAITAFHDRPEVLNQTSLIDLEELVHELELGLAHVRAVRETHDALDAARVAYDALASAEAALAKSERRFRLAFSENMAPMAFVNLDDALLDVNNAFVEMVGRSRDELLGRNTRWFTHPDDLDTTEDARKRLVNGEVEQIKYTKRFINRTGRTVVVEILKTPVRADDGRILYFIASNRDITEERQLSEQLLHRALHDPLTGLANRALFEDRLGQARERIVRSGGYGAVLLIDLDDFKGVNDTYGHHVGDRLLVDVARRFELVSRSIDTLGRVGGDEFLYLAEGLSGPEEAVAIAERLLHVLAEPFSLDGLAIEQHATIGVAIYNDGVIDGAEFIKRADAAMYDAKRRRRGHYELFEPTMLTSSVHRFTLAQSLSHALRSSELEMHYQPIVSLPTLQIVGFEALMRWNSSREGSIPPSVFIPIAEQSDLIFGLGDFAIREAIRAAVAWGADGSFGDQCYVSVNLSAAQFQSPELVAFVRDVLDEGGLPPTRLVIEITETAAVTDLDETVAAVDRLRAIGVGVALDAFGAGHSSLARLAELDPHMVKVDCSFIHSLDERSGTDVVLDAIFDLGHDLGVPMLAEGVETREQLEHLRAMGCPLVQGNPIAPPVPSDEVFVQLATRPKERLARISADSRR